jgi:hypothetical protein
MVLGVLARLVDGHVAEAAELHLAAASPVIRVAEVECRAGAPLLGDEATLRPPLAGPVGRAPIGAATPRRITGCVPARRRDPRSAPKSDPT